MKTITDLKTALLDLLHAVGDPDFRPMIGGGYGIYLKLKLVLDKGTRTLLTELPETRSTNDIDMFLRTELLVDGERLQPLKQALEDIGYTPVKGAEFYQFVKPGPEGGRAGSLKIDLLAGSRELLKECGLKADERRVRAKPKVNGLHAHPVDEAPTLEMNCTKLTIEGKLSSGDEWQAVVDLPHLFSFITMKLFAFRDRYNDEEKDYGRHHALDLYTSVAMATEEEWDQCKELRRQSADKDCIKVAQEIVKEFFENEDSMGMIRLKEHAYCIESLQLADFRSALLELFA